MPIINMLFYALLISIGVISAMALTIVHLCEKPQQKANKQKRKKRLIELPKRYNWDKGEEPEMTA